VSGKRSADGNLMAWLRLLINTVVAVMLESFDLLDIASVYAKLASMDFDA
jgi:hypothetical protein